MKLRLLGPMLLLSGVLLAQPAPDMEFSPHNMDAVRIWKLTEVLELTEEQTVSFLPVVQIHERKLRDAQHELMELGRSGQQLLAEADISQKQVDKLLGNYVKKQQEITDIKTEFVKTLPKYLTPQQQILYLGFEARFRQELRDFMKDKRGNDTKSRRGDRK